MPEGAVLLLLLVSFLSSSSFDVFFSGSYFPQRHYIFQNYISCGYLNRLLSPFGVKLVLHSFF